MSFGKSVCGCECPIFFGVYRLKEREPDSMVTSLFVTVRRNRRLTGAYEALALIAEGFAKLVMINLMLKRVAETKPKHIS
ncbi:MAG: hypothetical protein HOP13_05405 [Alphaproteobacteria bacterium]|nr:hypothetical protein [Alphaproteobacteria bacterium]